MGFQFSINKTNKTMDVYERKNEVTTHIGRIFPNEIFSQCEGENYHAVQFLSSAGQILTGEGYDEDLLNAWDVISKYPYYGESSPNSYDAPYVFKMRSTKNIYRADGSLWGSVAGGMYVATDHCIAGETKPYLMKIIYVKSTSGNWIKVDQANNGYGFVDTGFRTASGANNFGLIGSF